MESIESKTSSPAILANGCIVTLGDFDGIHLGHRKLLKKAKQIAEKDNLPVLLLSYNPSPKVILGKQKSGIQLLNPKERARILKEIGINVFYLYPFTKETTLITAKDFLRNFLLGTLKAKHIVIGYDHCFGRHRRGNYKYLKLASAKYNFGLTQCKEVSLWGKKISSSSIKSSLQAGKVEEASKKLGSLFPVSGTVIKGAQRGAKLGFPTANINISSDKILPQDGVYVTIALIKGHKYASITNIGKNPTFNLAEISVECHIFDFLDDIYNEEIVIYFVLKIRNEIKFSGIDQLKRQIEKDCSVAKNYFKRRKSLLSR